MILRLIFFVPRPKKYSEHLPSSYIFLSSSCTEETWVSNFKCSHQDVEVGVVLSANQSSEKLFRRCREVVLVADVNSGFPQHRDALGELQSERRVQELERLGRVLLANCLDLGVVPEETIIKIEWRFS